MRRGKRISALLGLVLLVFTGAYLQLARAQSGGSVTATAGTPTPDPVPSGQQATCPLSATAVAPTVLYPDSIVSGPTWKWTVSGPGTPTVDHPDVDFADATLKTTITQSGTYFLSATAEATWKTALGNTITRSGMTNFITFKVIGVEKLQYLGQSGYVDIMGMMGPLHVLVGSTVTFKAVATPTGTTYPAGQPVWSGAASGTGETVPVTFDTVADTTVTAKCGNSEVTVAIRVYDLIPKLTPQDNFEGRDLDAYGVCELVDLSFETAPPGIKDYEIGGLKWVIESGGGTLSTGTGGTDTYECAAEAAIAKLALQVVGGASAGQKKKAPEKEIMEPDGAKYVMQIHVPFVSVKRWHVNDTCSAGFCADNYATGKKAVSYDRIEVREEECKAETTGFVTL